MYLSLYCKFERVTQGLRVRGSWRLNRNCNILTPLLWPSALCLSRSPDAQPDAQGPLCWVMAFFTASYQQLLWSPNSIGVPEGPFGRAGLSLPHLVYNSVRSPTGTGLCDRHRAEITVMQFTGHSLPVHQSEVGPSPCPILSAELTCAISFDYWPLGCVTSAIFGMVGVIVIERK